MNLPGTYHILHILYGHELPPFAAHYLHLDQSPVIHRGRKWLIPPMVFFFCGGCNYLIFILPAIVSMLILYIIPPLTVIIGIVFITMQMGSAAARERHRWHDLLLIPQERYKMILYVLTDSFVPLFSVIGVLMDGLVVVIIVMVKTNYGLLAILLMPLICLEWVQMQAFAVAVGLYGTLGQPRSVASTAPLMLALSGMVLRSGAGLVIAGWTGSLGYAGLVAGPIISIVALPYVIPGLIVVALYLLGLEALIRVLFDRAVNHAGEGIA